MFCLKPGYDSGCTSVVALLRGRELYVANAGDSRCIVCRKGEAVEMSLDHKPEDQPESDRIVKAGGKVTADGRVNGGLNLSRALGDHAYKLNAELPAQEQMITALPDVRTLTIDPVDDEFMVLACDGIWNFMSSQEVCDFVRPRLQEGKEKLSTICEEVSCKQIFRSSSIYKILLAKFRQLASFHCSNKKYILNYLNVNVGLSKRTL